MSGEMILLFCDMDGISGTDEQKISGDGSHKFLRKVFQSRVVRKGPVINLVYPNFAPHTIGLDEQVKFSAKK